MKAKTSDEKLLANGEPAIVPRQDALEIAD